jgi:hypothetical protein
MTGPRSGQLADVGEGVGEGQRAPFSLTTRMYWTLSARMLLETPATQSSITSGGVATRAVDGTRGQGRIAAWSSMSRR